jgi:hypothetical protein
MILKNNNILKDKKLGRIIEYDNGWSQITIDDIRFYIKENIEFELMSECLQSNLPTPFRVWMTTRKKCW